MEKKLKIAYFLDNFYPQVNGVVTSSINTVTEFAKRGHKVYGIVPMPQDKSGYPEDYFPFPTFFHKGFPAYFYPDFQFNNPFSSKILKIMREFRPDIIHFHAPFTLGYAAIRIARKLQIPVVGTFHTFFAEPEYLRLINKENSIILQKIGWWYSNQFFKRCDAIVSPGNETANILKKNKLKKKIYVISNGVDVAKYSNFAFTKKYPVEIKKGDKWFLFIGRISQEKSIDVLLKAAEIVFTKIKEAKLLIVGDGPHKTELEKYVQKRNLTDKVFFTGMIPNKDLLESGILKEMKLFVTPSTSENQPMTILESIMFGLPIIGADAKGIPEMIDGNGIIVTPEDIDEFAKSIISLLTNEKLRTKFSKRSIELSDKCDIRNTTNQMEALYYKLVNARKSIDIKEID